MIKLELGDVVETKKPHPCGSKTFQIVRAGADYKLCCEQCKKVIFMTYDAVCKSVKSVNGEKVGK